jgi:tRNA/tmRNA/rRNA uracil-C5-methylase (TrmA/RlmC/RlmD family)
MSAAGPADEALLDIEALGAGGDGIARTPAGALFVPFALPGETVRVRTGPGDRATLLTVVDPSPDRVTPFCQHHGACGGCRLQHLAAPAYAAFKRDLVTAALGRRGLKLPGEPVLIDAQGSGRRRITLHAAMEDGRSLRRFGCGPAGASTCRQPRPRPVSMSTFAGRAKCLPPSRWRSPKRPDASASPGLRSTANRWRASPNPW